MTRWALLPEISFTSYLSPAERLARLERPHAGAGASRRLPVRRVRLDFRPSARTEGVYVASLQMEPSPVQIHNAGLSADLSFRQHPGGGTRITLKPRLAPLPLLLYLVGAGALLIWVVTLAYSAGLPPLLIALPLLALEVGGWLWLLRLQYRRLVLAIRLMLEG